MPLKVCEYKECGKEFYALHSYNRFCCFEHGIENRRKPRLEGDCEYCHKHFISKRTATDWHYTKGGFKLRYCTREHALLAQRKDKVKRICKNEQCGKEFYVFPSVVKNGGGNTCSRKCYHKWNSGERHHNWKGGYATEDRKIRKGRGSKPFRNAILKRDNFQCTQCGKQNTVLEVDHIYPWALFPELRHDVRNGRTLCYKCHGETPTWGRPNLERKDFMREGKLFDYVIDALFMIGVKDPLV